jgi:hypothetical protein
VEFHKPPEGEGHLITNFPTYHGITYNNFTSYTSVCIYSVARTYPVALLGRMVTRNHVTQPRDAIVVQCYNKWLYISYQDHIWDVGFGKFSVVSHT